MKVGVVIDNGPVVGGPRPAATGRWVVRGGESRGDEAVIGHLRPVVESNGLKLFQQYLGGALIFAGDPSGLNWPVAIWDSKKGEPGP